MSARDWKTSHVSSPIPKIGDVIRLWGHVYPEGFAFTKHEVRAVLAADEQVVLRRWNKRKQRWDYRCESFYGYQLDKERDGLRPEQEPKP